MQGPCAHGCVEVTNGDSPHTLLLTAWPDEAMMQVAFLLAVPPPHPAVLSHAQSEYDQMNVGHGGSTHGCHS